MSAETCSLLPGLPAPVTGHPFFPFDDEKHQESMGTPRYSVRPSFYSPTKRNSSTFHQMPTGEALSDADRTKYSIIQKNPVMFKLLQKHLQDGCRFHPSTLVLRGEIHSFVRDLAIVDVSHEIKNHRLVLEDSTSNTWFASSFRSMFSSSDHPIDDSSISSAIDSADMNHRTSGTWASTKWVRSSGGAKKPSTPSLSPLRGSGGWSTRNLYPSDDPESSPLDNKQHGHKDFDNRPSVTFKKYSIDDLEIPHCSKTESFTDSDSSSTCSRTFSLDDETSLSSPTSIEAQ